MDIEKTTYDYHSLIPRDPRRLISLREAIKLVCKITDITFPNRVALLLARNLIHIELAGKVYTVDGTFYINKAEKPIDLYKDEAGSIYAALSQMPRHPVTIYKDFKISIPEDENYAIESFGIFKQNYPLKQSKLLRDALEEISYEIDIPFNRIVWADYQIELDLAGFLRFLNAYGYFKIWEEKEEGALIKYLIDYGIVGVGDEANALSFGSEFFTVVSTALRFDLYKYYSDATKAEDETHENKFFTEDTSFTQSQEKAEISKVNSFIVEELSESNKYKELSGKAKTGHLNIIAVLLETALGEKRFKSQNQLITYLLEKYGDLIGISESNLKVKFSEANSNLNQSK